MDLQKVIAKLREELNYITSAIQMLEQLEQNAKPRRGRPLKDSLRRLTGLSIIPDGDHPGSNGRRR
ncbi:MAG: hypothetical protein JO323_20425 [Acidobacteriia bacterium]|nr:hypothetical protein [Terriglobia bacterium]